VEVQFSLVPGGPPVLPSFFSFSFFFLFGDPGGVAWGFMLARQVLYHLSLFTSPFVVLVIFWIGFPVFA
jgi:hypothetical protein